jgi:biotin carboxylase
MKHILLVGGVKDLHEKIKKLPLRFTLLMSKEKFNPTFFPSAEKILIMDFTKENEIVELIKFIHERDPFESVICMYEKEQPLACKLSKHLGVLNTSHYASYSTLNKQILRQILNDNDISKVYFKVCYDKKQLQSFSLSNGFPFILKPLGDWASTGVNKVNSVQQMNSLIDELEKQKLELSFPVLAEEFLSGKEVSVETFTINDKHILINITEKLLQNNTFIEIGHNIPYYLSNEIMVEIKDIVEKALDLINHKFGPAHTEVIITTDGPKIVESHTRPGGDEICHLIKNCTGIDIVDLMLDYQLNEISESTVPEFVFNRYSSIRFFDSPPGRIVSIAGVEEVHELSGVVSIHFFRREGDLIKPYKNSWDRIGYVILVGNTMEEIENVYKLVKNLIVIKVDEVV